MLRGARSAALGSRADRSCGPPCGTERSGTATRRSAAQAVPARLGGQPGAHGSQPRLLHLLLRLLLQRADLRPGLALAGVAAVRGKQLEAVGVADGLPQGALLAQQLLNGFVLPHLVVLDHLPGHRTTQMGGGRGRCSLAAPPPTPHVLF